ncbi:MAG: NIPSNAP family protein [Sneathiellales bacterium]|nr:NIPSNAP family protein [Sneathiellales bacterium]
MPTYEFATLQTKTSAAPLASEALEYYLKSSQNLGQLLGCWISEIGALNRIALLRRYEDDKLHDRERQALLNSGDPFGCGDHLSRIALDRCATFANVPEIGPGTYGPYYEIRTYEMEMGGMEPTLDTWARAVPIRAKRSTLVTVMRTVEGLPRMISIWPYPSIEKRQECRAQAIKDGIWPPAESFKHLKTDMLSTIYLPTSFSPLK